MFSCMNASKQAARSVTHLERLRRAHCLMRDALAAQAGLCARTMTLVPEEPERPTSQAGSEPRDGAQSKYDALLASAAPRQQRDPPTPDLVEIFHEQLAFLDTQYPPGTPSRIRAEHLEDLARVRTARLERLVQLEIADRVVAIVCRLCGSIVPAVAVVLVGRHVGAW
jgi:hypothetical protein